MNVDVKNVNNADFKNLKQTCNISGSKETTETNSGADGVTTRTTSDESDDGYEKSLSYGTSSPNNKTSFFGAFFNKSDADTNKNEEDKTIVNNQFAFDTSTPGGILLIVFTFTTVFILPCMFSSSLMLLMRRSKN
jgi:hypothetical protein